MNAPIGHGHNDRQRSATNALLAMEAAQLSCHCTQWRRQLWDTGARVPPRLPTSYLQIRVDSCSNSTRKVDIMQREARSAWCKRLILTMTRVWTDFQRSETIAAIGASTGGG